MDFREYFEACMAQRPLIKAIKKERLFAKAFQVEIVITRVKD